MGAVSMDHGKIRFDFAAPLDELMERYIDGDEKAFAQLHGRLIPKVRGRLAKLIRNPASVEDLLQLTFLRAHQARHRFSTDGGNRERAVEAWYLAIARNVALDHLRHQYRRDRRHASLEAKGDVEGMGAAGLLPDPEEFGLQRETEVSTSRRVREAIDGLPASQREVVRLHKLLGLSMAEVSERLNVRPGALRVRAHRAYKALAQTLGGGAGPSSASC